MSNMKFKIGDRVRVVGNTTMHQFPIGAEVKIMECQHYNAGYWCCDKNEDCWYCRESDLAPIEEPAATIHEATEPEGKKPSVSEPTLLLKLLTGGDKQFYSRENFHKELCKYQHFHLQDGIYFIRDIMSPSSITVIKVTEQLESIWHENALIQVKIVFDLTLRISEVASIVASMTKDYPNNYQQILGMLTSTIQAIREATNRNTQSPEAARKALIEAGIEPTNKVEFDDTPLGIAAADWVFETNGHRWSNNNSEAADNYGSFIAGAKWAAGQTASLQAENENLWKKSGELVNHFVGRTKIELEQPNKIYLQADVAKDAEVTWSEDRASDTDVCYIRIDAYERLQAEKAELVEALEKVDEVLDDDDKDRKKVKKMLTALLKRY